MEQQERVGERELDQPQRAKPDAPPSRLTRALLILTLIILVGEWAYVVVSATKLTPPHVTDFAVYYAAASLLRHDPHGALYSVTTLQSAVATYGGCPQSVLFNGYVYPPLLAILLEPFTYLTCAQALVVWTLVNALLWALSALILVDMLRTRWPTPEARLGLWALVIGGSVAFWQNYPGLYLGQTHLLLLFCLALGIWLEQNNRPWLAGAVIVFAALIRPLPALLLVYYLVQKRWAVIGGALAAGLALLVVMLLGVGWETLVRSVPATLFATVAQAHPGKDGALMVVAGPSGVALALLAGCVYMVTIVFRRGGDTALGAAWTLCTMLLVSPLVWGFYFVWLFPAFAICLREGRSITRYRAAFYGSLAVIYALLAAPFWPLLSSFALLALWVLCGAMYWRSSSPALRLASAVAVT